MTGVRRTVRLLALLLLLVGFALPGTAGRPVLGAACSIGSPINLGESFERNASNSQILLVGTVVQERSIPRPPNTTQIWESVIAPQAMLRGDALEEPLRIPYIGFLGGDCSGGPRLEVGERVLLPIYWGNPSYGDGSSAWQLQGIYSKVVFEDGTAYLESALDRHRLGDLESVVRMAGDAVGASEAQIEAAIAAATAIDTGVDGTTDSATDAAQTGGQDSAEDDRLLRVGLGLLFAAIVLAAVVVGRRVWGTRRHISG